MVVSVIIIIIIIIIIIAKAMKSHNDVAFHQFNVLRSA